MYNNKLYIICILYIIHTNTCCHSSLKWVLGNESEIRINICWSCMRPMNQGRIFKVCLVLRVIVLKQIFPFQLCLYAQALNLNLSGFQRHIILGCVEGTKENGQERRIILGTWHLGSPRTYVLMVYYHYESQKARKLLSTPVTSGQLGVSPWQLWYELKWWRIIVSQYDVIQRRD